MLDTDASPAYIGGTNVRDTVHDPSKPGCERRIVSATIGLAARASCLILALAFLALILVALPSVAPATTDATPPTRQLVEENYDNRGNITGRVVDNSTGWGVDRALVKTLANETLIDTVYTDANGTFTTSQLEPGAYVLNITRAFYSYWQSDTITVRANTTTELNAPVRLVDQLAPPQVPIVVRDREDSVGNALTVSWDDYTPPNDIAEYRVYYSDTRFDTIAGMAPGMVIDAATNRTTVVIDQLVPDQRYYIAVIAVDRAGNHWSAVSPEDGIPKGEEEATFVLAVGPILDEHEEPLPNATVTVIVPGVGDGESAQTNELGLAQVDAPTEWRGKEARVEIVKSGYQPETRTVTIPAEDAPSDIVPLTVVMQPEPDLVYRPWLPITLFAIAVVVGFVVIFTILYFRRR